MNEIKIIKDIAEKLSDINFVDKILLEKDNYLTVDNNKFYPYGPLSLSHGIPGLCLLYAELNKLYPNEGWDDLSNYYIKMMVDHMEKNGLSEVSLFSGTAGIALSIMANSCNGKNYNSLLNTLNDYLIKQLNVNLNYLMEKRTIESLDYDTMQGVAGTANYLLLNYKKEKDSLKKILQYFVNLSEHNLYNNINVPNWLIKKENMFSDYEKKCYSNGILNLGLSHGIPGPLIILCKSYSKNIIVDGEIESIKRIVKDIIKLKIKGTNSWNGIVEMDEYINGAYNLNATRDAWCYGTPGLSYSLLVSSITLADNNLFQLSCNAMKESLKRRKELFSPSFCHGYSGLAYLSYKFYCKTKDKLFLNESENLLEKILSYYNNKAPFGFYNIEYSDDCGIKNQNSIALIDGVVGILLTILELTHKTNNVYWDTAFLLDD